MHRKDLLFSKDDILLVSIKRMFAFHATLGDLNTACGFARKSM
jgi:hypothetical protein